ncbi:MAG: class I SAM-dependent methyltransferase, partial [Ilumatobacteraceae bacterium]
ITWEHLDVTAAELPPGPFDLVTAQFLHFSPDQREAVYAALATAVAPGGTLMIVGHHPSDMDAGVGRPRWPEMFFTADELAAPLGDEWTIVAADARRRHVDGPDDTPVTVCDAVLVARRAR